jgi:CBS domain-containing protein
MDTKPVSVLNVMTIDPIVVDVDATLEEVDLVLRSTFITGLPVVDGDGRLVGIISHADLAAFRFAGGQPQSNDPMGTASASR